MLALRGDYIIPIISVIIGSFLTLIYAFLAWYYDRKGESRKAVTCKELSSVILLLFLCIAVILKLFVL